MNQNKMKLVYWLGFILCGGASCWATAESLCLLSNWHLILCYLITIAFFIISSFGVKLVIDSFGRGVQNPVLQLMGGTILVIIFWLICSMPTNTHTFFISQHGKELAYQDIATTQKYLTNLQNYNGTNESKYLSFCEHIDSLIANCKSALYGEICGNNKGNGDNARKIITDYEKAIGQSVGVSSDLAKNRTKEAYDSYVERIDRAANMAKNERRNELANQNEAAVNAKLEKDATKHLKALDKIKRGLDNGDISITNLEDFNNINRELTDSYNLIKNNSEIAGLAPIDKERYTAEKLTTDTKRATSVYDMVGDWWSGKYNNFGIGLWILLSILLDVASFIFFYLATRKNEYF